VRLASRPRTAAVVLVTYVLVACLTPGHRHARNRCGGSDPLGCLEAQLDIGSSVPSRTAKLSVSGRSDFPRVDGSGSEACALCRFLSQNQSPPTRLRVALRRAVVRRAAEATRTCRLRRFYSPLCPRPPPLVV